MNTAVPPLRATSLITKLLATAAFVSAVTGVGLAQTVYDFHGTIVPSNIDGDTTSLLYPSGSSVELTITLPSLVPAGSAGATNLFSSQDSLAINGTTVSTATGFVSAVFNNGGNYGFDGGVGSASWNGNIQQVELTFYSSSPATVDAYGLPISGLPILDFAVSSGLLADTTWNVGGNNTQGIAVFDLTSYSVSAIPEPSTYAAVAGLAVLGLTMYRRRKRSTGAVGLVPAA